MKPAKNKIAVIGGGAAGLFFAHAALEQGYEPELFEFHSKPGGCAGYFGRSFGEQKVSFDAGATLLWGFDKEFPFLKTLIDRWQITLPPFHRREEIHFCLKQKNFSLRVSSPEAFKQDLQKNFPKEPVTLWEKMEALQALAGRLQSFMSTGAHLPLERLQDLRLNLRRFPKLVHVLPDFVNFSQRSLKDELLDAGASQDFLQWVDMTLLISLQDRSERVSTLLGSLALFFYTFGVGSLEGGMKSLFVALKETLESKATTHFRCEIVDIRKDANDLFSLVTKTNEIFSGYHYVLSAIPRYNLKELTRLPVQDCDFYHYQQGLWSALLAYYVVEDSPDFPESAFNTHLASQDFGEHYLSFSARSDTLACPTGFRRLSMSTHESPEGWPCEDRTQAKIKKTIKAQLMKNAFFEAFPKATLVFEDYASPQTFYRYTKRKNGCVGGIPLNLEHSLLRSPSQRSGIKNLYLIGDTSFPGQSVYSCALGALLCLEKISNRSLLGSRS